MKNQLSIIIPTYNRAHLIGRAINSVLKQAYENYEIIVVDDASQDDTASVIMGLNSKRIKYIRLENNTGQQGSRNAGVLNSGGDWILFFDSDDELISGALSLIVSYVKKVDSKIGVIAFPAIDPQTRQYYGAIDGDEVRLNYRDIICENKAKGEFIKCVRREVFDNNQFNEGVRGLNSLFWWSAARKWDSLYVNKPLRLYYRGREDNIMNPKNILWRSEHLSRGMEMLLREHGETLKKCCPEKLAEKYIELSYYFAVCGKKIKSITNLLQYFKYSKKIFCKSFFTVIGYLLLGRRCISFIKTSIK